jgi:hypothetical protein
MRARGMPSTAWKEFAKVLWQRSSKDPNLAVRDLVSNARDLDVARLDLRASSATVKMSEKHCIVSFAEEKRQKEGYEDSLK